MPITQSAKKALRQSKKRHLENLKFKRGFKSAVKDFRKEVSAGNLEKAKTFLPVVYQAVDKAAKKGVIKKNTASRYKSRLAQSLNKKQNKA
ncbi:MAG: 30S ribosomal protein S20 [Candidatus Yanofskybacteria bacterium]|nr:30S ribosomal protein S20 [Candidatus Yanofskybacteria bacterium]